MRAAAAGYLNVFLLDDHDIVRQGLRDLLAPARDLRVVGDSGRAVGASDAILRLDTHVMVLDLHLQDGSGVHVCRQVRAVNPDVQGILVTSADDDEALAATVLAGAAGFVVKLARSSDVLGAIRRLSAGKTLLDHDLRERAASVLRARTEALVPPLTGEEGELLDLVLGGRTDHEVAELLRLELSFIQEYVAGLVDRVMGRVPEAAEAVDGAPTGGKHRRTI